MAIYVFLYCTIYSVMHFRGGLFCINIPEDWIKCGVSKHRDRHDKTSVTRGGHAPAHDGDPGGGGASPQWVMTHWTGAKRPSEILARHRLYLLHHFNQLNMLTHDYHVHMIPTDII